MLHVILRALQHLVTTRAVIHIPTPSIAFLLTRVLNLSGEDGFMDQPEVLAK